MFKRRYPSKQNTKKFPKTKPTRTRKFIQISKIAQLGNKLLAPFIHFLTRIGVEKSLKIKQALKLTSYKLAYKIGFIVLLLGLSYSSVLFISKKWNFYALELVKIVGVERLHPYELLEELNLEKGTSLLTLNSTSLEQKLLSRPQIQKVKVTKVYPATLKILIEEKQVAFLVKTPAQMYAISQHGEILFTGNGIDQHNYFIIEIETKLGSQTLLQHKELSTFLTYFNQLSAKEKELQKLFSGIYFGKEIFLFTKHERVTLNLGKELSLEKLRKARYAYLYKKQKNIQKSLIDLRFNFVRFTS